MTTETPKPRRPRKPQSRLPAALAVVGAYPEIADDLSALTDNDDPITATVERLDATAARHKIEMARLRASRDFAEAIASLTETDLKYLRTVLAEVAGTRG